MACAKILKEEFDKRKKNNKSYSLRAFARDLEISKTTLADVLNGKRFFSEKTATKVASKLKLPNIAGLLQRTSEAKLGSAETIKEKYLTLTEAEFSRISDWKYMAILNVAKIKNVAYDESQFAKRMGISLGEANVVLSDLVAMKLIEIQNGKIVRTSKPIRTSDNVPSSSIRKYHKANLKKSEYALENLSIEERIFSAISLPISSSKMQEANNLIVEFKEKFSALVSSYEADSVYTLSLQFFPIMESVDKKNSAKGTN